MKKHLGTIALIAIVVLVSWPGTGRTEPPEARAVIDAWLKAQNNGDFALYSSLYLDSFTGVKRSGAEEYTFRHQSWLKDRQGMFKNKFKVTIENLLLTEEAGAYKVTFVQTWESGTYKDRGAKVIVLKKKDGRLGIAREEMLNSTVLASAKGVTDLTHKGKLFFIMDDRYIVFAKGYDPGLGTGKPVSAAGKAKYLGGGVKKAVDPGRVTNNYRDFTGAEFRVYDRKNKYRPARVSRLWLMTEYIPHFGEAQGYEEEDLDQAELLERVWQTGSEYEGNVFLVGEIALEGGDNVWCLPAKNPEPVFYEAVAADPLFDQVQRLSKNHQAYRDYLSDLKAVDAAERPDYGTEFTVAGFRDTRTGKTFFKSSIEEGNPCGGDAYLGLGLFWEKQGSSARLLDSFTMQTYEPIVVMDVDGDGSPEVLFDGPFGMYYQLESRTMKSDIVIPFMDCGC